MSNIKPEEELVLTRISPTDEEVQILIEKLNQYQIGLYGLQGCTLESADSLEKNQAYMIGIYAEQTLTGIGALKIFDTYAEVKRMYVEEKFRRKGIAESILQHLEHYALNKGIKRVCLETGNLHNSALRFYKKLGYTEIERFGNYHPNDVSVYFEKVLT